MQYVKLGREAELWINANKPEKWKSDIAESVRYYNKWFMEHAPKAYRDSRELANKKVRETFVRTSDLQVITADVIREHPKLVQVLRMCTAPPIAQDRLAGLAQVKRTLIKRLEEGRLPSRMAFDQLNTKLGMICKTVRELLDKDLFSWLVDGTQPDDKTRDIAAIVVADRLTGADADPIIRNAQEDRQLWVIRKFLTELGYQEQSPSSSDPREMVPGTFCMRHSVSGGKDGNVKIPIDAIIQPKNAKIPSMPILIEAKSAGDFTNPNKRRKEEAQKIRQLRERYGEGTRMILFLCGYFNPGYLGYEAAERLDWVWEHRIEDLKQLGL